MDEADGRPGHVATQLGHWNASWGARTPIVSLALDDSTKQALTTRIAAQVLNLPRGYGMAVPKSRDFNRFCCTQVRTRGENDHENLSGK
jgi:hypothetical protein